MNWKQRNSLEEDFPAKIKTLYGIVILMMLAVLLTACGHDKAPVNNKNVTLENMKKIKIGDKKTGEGGTTYSDVVSIFDKEPHNRSEIAGEPNRIEADWYYDIKGYKSITVNFVHHKAVKKSQTGLK